MRATAKTLLGPFILMFASFSLSAQSSSPDLQFGGHTLGEPADVFFLTARVAESKQLTKDYCKTLLNNPKVMEKVQEKTMWPRMVVSLLSTRRISPYSTWGIAAR
jgi:hypothetical protein